MMMHKMMGTFFFFLLEVLLFDGALGKHDEKLRCSTTILGGQKFCSLFLKVS